MFLGIVVALGEIHRVQANETVLVCMPFVLVVLSDGDDDACIIGCPRYTLHLRRLPPGKFSLEAVESIPKV